MRTVADGGCIFCGATPRTREHLWPDWLRREMAISAPHAYRLEQEEDGVETRDHSFMAKVFTQTVRAVCGKCNGGWMSQIEADAKPILQPLIQARGRRLHRAEQRKIATWALLKAVVFDQLHPQELTVPAAHRAYLFEHKQPPPGGLWVRLASYEAAEPGHYAYQGMKLAREGELAPDESTVYFATITVGALVLQLSGSLISQWSFGQVPYPDEFNVAEVWPATASVEFVQKNLMTHETLVSYTKALYNVVGKLSGGAPSPR